MEFLHLTRAALIEHDSLEGSTYLFWLEAFVRYLVTQKKRSVFVTLLIWVMVPIPILTEPFLQ